MTILRKKITVTVTAILMAAFCAPMAMADEPVASAANEEAQTSQDTAACGERVNAEPARFIQTGSRVARPANSSYVRVYSREELQLAQAGGGAAMAEPVCR